MTYNCTAKYGVGINIKYLIIYLNYKKYKFILLINIKRMFVMRP